MYQVFLPVQKSNETIEVGYYKERPYICADFTVGNHVERHIFYLSCEELNNLLESLMSVKNEVDKVSK